MTETADPENTEPIVWVDGARIAMLREYRAKNGVRGAIVSTHHARSEWMPLSRLFINKRED